MFLFIDFTATSFYDGLPHAVYRKKWRSILPPPLVHHAPIWGQDEPKWHFLIFHYKSKSSKVTTLKFDIHINLAVTDSLKLLIVLNTNYFSYYRPIKLSGPSCPHLPYKDTKAHLKTKMLPLL